VKKRRRWTQRQEREGQNGKEKLNTVKSRSVLANIYFRGYYCYIINSTWSLSAIYPFFYHPNKTQEHKKSILRIQNKLSIRFFFLRYLEQILEYITILLINSVISFLQSRPALSQYERCDRTGPPKLRGPRTHSYIITWKNNFQIWFGYCR